MSTIHIAAKNGNIADLTKLINEGVDINQYDRQKLTPLHHAAYYYQTEVLKVLSQHGDFQVDIVDGDNLTALHIAVYYGHYYFIKEIIRLNANINHLNKYNMNVLHVAINNLIDIKLIKLLIKSGINIDAVDIKSRTPLHLAVLRNLTNVVKLLLEYNANNTIKNTRGHLPIDIVTDNDEIKLLLTNYVYIDGIKQPDS